MYKVDDKMRRHEQSLLLTEFDCNNKSLTWRGYIGSFLVSQSVYLSPAVPKVSSFRTLQMQRGRGYPVNTSCLSPREPRQTEQCGQVSEGGGSWTASKMEPYPLYSMLLLNRALWAKSSALCREVCRLGRSPAPHLCS